MSANVADVANNGLLRGELPIGDPTPLAQQREKRPVRGSKMEIIKSRKDGAPGH